MLPITKNTIAVEMINGAFLILLNLIFISIIGFMTLDSHANFNSMVGGILLSFFIPAFIVFKTKTMDRVERLVKFGSGCLLYLISALLIVGFPHSFTSGLVPSLVIFMSVLFYGQFIFKDK